MDVPEPLPLTGHPPLAFRFGVFFFAGGGQSNSIDTLFQKVSGIGASVQTAPVHEGGQNLYLQQLPQAIQHDNLVLERGLVVGSPLALELDAALSLFQFSPSNVLVSLLDKTSTPVASWLFLNAHPVKWSLSALNATANEVVIETIELTYQSMQPIRL